MAQSAGDAEYTENKQSGYEAFVILELWGTRSDPSLPSLSGSL